VRREDKGAALPRGAPLLPRGPLLTIPRVLLMSIAERLRSCSAGVRECVVYIVASLDVPGTGAGRVVAWYHPAHEASATHYHVPLEEMWRMSEALYRDRQRIAGQFHTHPGAAFHSNADNEGLFLPVPGYLSVVVPRFAEAGLSSFRSCYATRYMGGGCWEEIPQPDIVARIRVDES